MKIIKATMVVIVSLLLISVILLFVADRIVEKSSVSRTYNSANDIPSNKVGILLGTSKFLQNGRVNLYYKYRIDAAVELYNSGKIKFILVSGDNSTKSYDEPTKMKEDLVKRGIPADKIYLDYAGFRTLDSMIRCTEVFGQKSITIISQQFHNERAIYISDKKDIIAVGFNAKDVGKRYGFKVLIREKFARVKMMIDLIFGKKSKFLGEKIVIK